MPHRVVFPGLRGDFDEFKRLLRTLSRTDTLLWCARLNLHMGYSLINDPKDVQKHCVSLFFGADEVDRLNDFVREHGEGISVFFRGQLLELMRWASVLCADQPDDGSSFNSPEVRRRFARAALLASDVWARRIYPDDLKIEGSVDDTRRRVLAALRQSDVETSAGPHPFLALARGACIAEHLVRRAPDADEAFRRKTGLALEDYMLLIAYIGSLSLLNSVADLTTPQKSGLLSTADLAGASARLGASLRSYLSCESQSAEDLRAAFWGGRTDSDEQEAGWFTLTPLRAKPLLCVGNDRAIVTDPTLFAERPTAGPLFHLVGAESGKKANRWFGKFGDAFEDYVRTIMLRIFGDVDETHLVRRYIPNPMGKNERGKTVELTDGVLLSGDTVVLFEAKAVWLRDDLAAPGTDPAAYMEHLRERYGVTSSGDGRRDKGLGQLARTIKGLSSAALRSRDVSLAGVGRVLPVLLVHDTHLSAAVHPHFLAEEFVAAMGADGPRAAWEDLRHGPLRVAHLIVLTVDDIELLETLSSEVPVLQCLDEYATASPDRMTSFYNFLVTSHHREKLGPNKWLMAKRDELVDRVVERFFS